MLLLLPPSEGKTSGGQGRWNPGGGRFRTLKEPRSQVTVALADAMRDVASAGRLLGLKEVALEEARRANLDLLKAKTLPSHLRYAGVVWSHLDEKNLDSSARARAEASVVVVSGLMGLSAWNDPVPMYKAKMGLRLPEVGALGAFWKPLLGRALRSKYKGEVGINMLPQDCERALDFDAIGLSERIDVRFVDKGRKAVGHNAKAAKGALARRLLEAEDDPIATITRFAFNEWAGTDVIERNGRTTVVTVVAH